MHPPFEAKPLEKGAPKAIHHGCSHSRSSIASVASPKLDQISHGTQAFMRYDVLKQVRNSQVIRARLRAFAYLSESSGDTSRLQLIYWQLFPFASYPCLNRIVRSLAFLIKWRKFLTAAI